MYLHMTYKAPNLVRVATSRPPFGPGFDSKEVEQATHMEAWATSFRDPGADMVEFRLFKDDEKIGTKIVGGY